MINCRILYLVPQCLLLLITLNQLFGQENESLAVVEVVLDGNQSSLRGQESNLANLLTDAYIYGSLDKFQELIDDPNAVLISLLDASSIGIDTTIFPGQVMTIETISELLPRNDTLSFFGPITLEQLRIIFEESLSLLPSLNSRFIHPGGISLSFDQTLTSGQRIVDMTSNDGVPFIYCGEIWSDVPSIYGVTSNSLLDSLSIQHRLTDLSLLSAETSEQIALQRFLVEDGGLGGMITAFDYPDGGDGRLKPFEQPNTIFELLSQSPFHNDIVSAIGLLNQEALFQSVQPITLFAPVDDALNTIPEDILNRVVEDPFLGFQLFQYHIVDGITLSEELTDGIILSTQQGENIQISLSDSTLQINQEANITFVDKRADNGIVHFIDQFLIPPSVTSREDVLDLDQFNVIVSPNPFNDVLNVQYQLPEASEIKLELLDLQGRSIKILQPATPQSSGSYSFEFDVKNVPSGMYSLTLSIADQFGGILVVKQ